MTHAKNRGRARQKQARNQKKTTGFFARKRENDFCEECQHSRSICEGDDNRDCECLRNDGGYFAESDYGDGPGA